MLSNSTDSIFFWQLEKAREATDAANIRAAYAEVMTAQISGETSTTGNVKVTGAASPYTYTANVTATQKNADWTIDMSTIGGQTVAASTTCWTITMTSDDTAPTITAQ